MNTDNNEATFTWDCPPEFRCSVNMVCSMCNTTRYIHIEAHHWAICRIHRICTYIGSNLLSEWRDTTPNDWKRNSELISKYRHVDCPCEECDNEHSKPVERQYSEEERNEMAARMLAILNNAGK